MYSSILHARHALLYYTNNVTQRGHSDPTATPVNADIETRVLLRLLVLLVPGGLVLEADEAGDGRSADDYEAGTTTVSC